MNISLIIFLEEAGFVHDTRDCFTKTIRGKHYLVQNVRINCNPEDHIDFSVQFFKDKAETDWHREEYYAGTFGVIIYNRKDIFNKITKIIDSISLIEFCSSIDNNIFHFSFSDSSAEDKLLYDSWDGLVLDLEEDYAKLYSVTN